MRRILQSQQGVAMIMALGAIVIIGVLMGSVLFVSTQDYRVGSNTVRTARAAAAAELGLNRIPVDWNLADNARLKTGDTLKKAYTAPRGATANVVVTRLAAADSNTYFNYGSSNYQSLAASANLTYAGGTLLTGVQPLIVGGVCQANAIPANWGEPNHATPAGACDTYFPIIHVLGDLKVTTGRGQGILLVDGDLTLSGNFQFDGAVIARGGLKMSGTGNKIVGATMAASVSVDDNVGLSGNTSLLYSSCALQSALSASAYPTRAIQRAWV